MATVLIVDDFKAGQRLVSAMLKFTNYNVIGLDSGDAAVDYLHANPVDLIITDIDMPDMDGIELCQYIKQHADFYHIPVVMLTAHHSNQTRYASMEAGADDYLTKPVSKPELVRLVEQILPQGDAAG
ncbi:MAG: response regulator, partial [Chloroflexota bacterium]